VTVASSYTVTLKLFAVFRETLGAGETSLAVAAGTTVDQVLAELALAHPTLAQWVGVTRFAVNQTFVSGDYVLQPGDEIVFVPPVSGG